LLRSSADLPRGPDMVLGQFAGIDVDSGGGTMRRGAGAAGYFEAAPSANAAKAAL
jgi:hypothetical protein